VLFATGILHWRKKDILTAGKKFGLKIVGECEQK
jgi:hypothetical protein